MDFSIFLERLGLNPEDFVNKPIDPIKIDNGYIYEVEQNTNKRKCPFCGFSHTSINGYYVSEKRCHQNEYLNEFVRIKRVRFKCPKCKKTFTPELSGIPRNSNITNQTLQFIFNDFTRNITFEDIGKKYGISTSYVIELFDKLITNVPRRPMPRVLCIDEIGFDMGEIGKYICVLYDFESKEIVDIIQSRKLAYLRRYFSDIPLKERENVEIFISDMYDGYATIKDLFFKSAIHVVDNFHVVTQLTRAVNQVRIRTMKSITDDDSPYKYFMKNFWKLFLKRNEDIPNKKFFHEKTLLEEHFDWMIAQCIKYSDDFWEGYLTLQDIYHHSYYSTFDESLKFVEFISNKLRACDYESLKKAGETYWKWRVQIANAFTREVKGIKYTNAIAECINNKLKTIIKSAYGYRNFERFRKRALLICTYTKF